jgi:hypothetical protein
VAGLLLRRARGTVIAETERVFEMIVPKKAYRVSSCTNVEKHTLEMFGKALPLDGGNFLPKGKSTSLLEKRENVYVFGFLKLPVEFVTKTYTVNETEEYIRKADECENIYNTRLDAVKNEILESAEILSYDTTSEEHDGYFRYITKFCCREDIGEEIPFEIRENSY